MSKSDDDWLLCQADPEFSFQRSNNILSFWFSTGHQKTLYSVLFLPLWLIWISENLSKDTKTNSISLFHRDFSESFIHSRNSKILWGKHGALNRSASLSYQAQIAHWLETLFHILQSSACCICDCFHQDWFTNSKLHTLIGWSELIIVRLLGVYSLASNPNDLTLFTDKYTAGNRLEGDSAIILRRKSRNISTIFNLEVTASIAANTLAK